MPAHFIYFIQHCFIYRPLDSTVPEDAGIEPLGLLRPWPIQSAALTTRLDLIHNLTHQKLIEKNVSPGEDDGKVSLRTLATQAQE